MNIEIDKINKIARDAGHLVLKYYNTECNINTKDDRSPVTAADRAGHEVIKTGIGKLYPAIPVLLEEGEHPPFEIRKTWDLFWLVNPLDETKEFINKRGGQYIALIKEDHPLLWVLINEKLKRILE